MKQQHAIFIHLLTPAFFLPAAFSVNRSSVFIELAHVAAVDLIEDLFDLVLKAVGDDGAEQDVELVSQRIRDRMVAKIQAGAEFSMALWQESYEEGDDEKMAEIRARVDGQIVEVGFREGQEVKKGDTLAKIARDNKQDGVSLNQMLIALYRANQDAFINGNMNLIRTGKILSIPDRDAAAGIDAARNDVLNVAVLPFDTKQADAAAAALDSAAPCSNWSQASMPLTARVLVWVLT